MHKAIGMLLACAALAIAPPPAQAATYQGRCIDVYDVSDIVVDLNGHTEQVRLIGVAPLPASQTTWAERGRDFTRNLVLDRTVRLDTDVMPRDRDGHLLAYVTTGGNFVNLDAVRNGYATVSTMLPNLAHANELLLAQREAVANGRGIWSPQGGMPSPWPTPQPLPTWTPTPRPTWVPSPAPSWPALIAPKHHDNGKHRGWLKGKGHHKDRDDDDREDRDDD